MAPICVLKLNFVSSYDTKFGFRVSIPLLHTVGLIGAVIRVVKRKTKPKPVGTIPNETSSPLTTGDVLFIRID
jgi:hypothetical protein